MPSDETRLDWFRRGARCARLYLKVAEGHHPPPLYACPECFTLLPESALTDRTLPESQRLSDEHVPSDGLGGKVMLLTCKPCNDRAGHNLDWHAQRAEEAHNFDVDRRLNAPVRARFTIPGVTWVSTDFMMTDEGGHFIVKEAGGPRENIETLKTGMAEWLKAAKTRDDMTIQLRLYGLDHKPRHADASWLRSAYLAAFAQFGYELIADHVYDAIRRQIRHPEAEQGLSPFLFPSPSPDRWGLILVPPGKETSGVLVMMGRRFVHLPLPGDITFWSRVHEMAGRGGQTVNFTGAERAWPSEPVLEIDEHKLKRGSKAADA